MHTKRLVSLYISSLYYYLYYRNVVGYRKDGRTGVLVLVLQKNGLNCTIGTFLVSLKQH